MARAIHLMKPDPDVIAVPIRRPALLDDGGSLEASKRSDLADTAQKQGRVDDPHSPVCDGSVGLHGMLPDPSAQVSADPPATELHALSFMRDALVAEPSTRRSEWPVHVAVATLFLGLVAQATFGQRDWLAASAPASAPLLQALCERLDCEIRPVRRIEALVVDRSSLSKLAADGYHLQLAVRNRSGITVAAPGIELTLTDIQDRPVVRRVLLPFELGATATIAAHDEWTAGATIALASQAERVVGYKVLAFYP